LPLGRFVSWQIVCRWLAAVVLRLSVSARLLLLQRVEVMRVGVVRARIRCAGKQPKLRDGSLGITALLLPDNTQRAGQRSCTREVSPAGRFMCCSHIRPCPGVSILNFVARTGITYVNLSQNGLHQRSKRPAHHCQRPEGGRNAEGADVALLLLLLLLLRGLQLLLLPGRCPPFSK
jgi:hypothetical protein